MPTKKGFGVAILVVAATISVQGQQEKGDLELQLQGTFSATVGADVSTTIGSISGKFAPFLTENIQVGVGPTLTITTTSITTLQPGTGIALKESTTKTTVGSTVFVVYSFLLKNARAVPYLGASWYKRDFSNGNDRGWVGANGGAKFYFTKKTAADFSMNYLTSLNPETKGGLLLFAFGLSFLV